MIRSENLDYRRMAAAQALSAEASERAGRSETADAPIPAGRLQFGPAMRSIASTYLVDTGGLSYRSGWQ